MDFQYATGTFKPTIDKPREKPRSMTMTWYENGKFHYKDEQGIVWVSRDGKTWEVRK